MMKLTCLYYNTYFYGYPFNDLAATRVLNYCLHITDYLIPFNTPI